jgi:hypothetical protein
MIGPFDWLGWLATAVIVSSYFVKQPNTLRRIQALSACLWGVYGALIDAPPVIAANVLVASAALWTSFRRSGGRSPATNRENRFDT